VKSGLASFDDIMRAAAVLEFDSAVSAAISNAEQPKK
jgi:hypothetical protein